MRLLRNFIKVILILGALLIVISLLSLLVVWMIALSWQADMVIMGLLFVVLTFILHFGEKS